MTTTRADRIRDALGRKTFPGDCPTVSVVSHARLADGSPEIARHVFPPLTIEDDDAVNDRWQSLASWTTWEQAARALLAEHDALAARLDADRGRDNGGCGDPLPTLRAILTRTHEPTFPGDPPSLWEWLAQLDDGALRAFRAGMWDSNQLDKEAAAFWEIDRRTQGVTLDDARAMLARKG